MINAVKRLRIVLPCFCLALFFACNETEVTHENASNDVKEASEVKEVEVKPYLGMKLPGDKHEVFAPGIVSMKDFAEYSCTFSPDGSEFYFSRNVEEFDDGPPLTQILVSKIEGDHWTEPEAVSFSSEHRDYEPHFAHDGSGIYFNSTRPLPNEDVSNRHGLWFVERYGGAWEDEEYLDQGMSVSITDDGTLFFTDTDKRSIRTMTKTEDGFANRQDLKCDFQRRNTQHPLVSHDGTFLVFDAIYSKGQGKGRETDLYVSFLKEDGTWGEAINLGSTVNKEGGGAGMCAFSPDGKYFFYSYKDDLYWVKADFIYDLKP